MIGCDTAAWSDPPAKLLGRPGIPGYVKPRRTGWPEAATEKRTRNRPSKNSSPKRLVTVAGLGCRADITRFSSVLNQTSLVPADVEMAKGHSAGVGDVVRLGEPVQARGSVMIACLNPGALERRPLPVRVFLIRVAGVTEDLVSVVGRRPAWFASREHARPSRIRRGARIAHMAVHPLEGDRAGWEALPAHLDDAAMDPDEPLPQGPSGQIEAESHRPRSRTARAVMARPPHIPSRSNQGRRPRRGMGNRERAAVDPSSSMSVPAIPGISPIPLCCSPSI